MIIRCARTLAAVSLATVLVAGCGSATRASAQQRPPVSTESESAGWLVWSTAEDGAARTVWLDANGTEVAARDDVVLAHGPRLYQARLERTQTQLPTCEQIEGESAAPPAGENAFLTRLSLVELGTGRRLVVVEPRTPEGEASLEQRVALVSSLGPYVFVRTTLASFMCGAHGNVEDTIRAFDIARGEIVELAAPAEDALSERASELLIADAERTTGDPPELGSLRREASMPILDEGRVAMEHVFVVDACYACSDPRWSSYTRAAFVRDPTLPPELAPHAAFPEPIQRWLAAHPDARGISVVPAAQTERTRRLFDGGVRAQ